MLTTRHNVTVPIWSNTRDWHIPGDDSDVITGCTSSLPNGVMFFDRLRCAFYWKFLIKGLSFNLMHGLQCSVGISCVACVHTPTFDGAVDGVFCCSYITICFQLQLLQFLYFLRMLYNAIFSSVLIHSVRLMSVSVWWVLARRCFFISVCRQKIPCGTHCIFPCIPLYSLILCQATGILLSIHGRGLHGFQIST